MNTPNYLNTPAQFPPDFAAAWGQDDYGYWFDIDIKGIEQRFRWIPQGTFMMGATAQEKGDRFYAKETQHQVTLKQSFWLADTSCTQALWKAVLGKNPAHFSDDELNPIESVSWIDVQIFLEKLNQNNADFQVRLPTEAEWEYACRAGTTTPFSFGSTINSDQVNYDGQYPYGDGEKGEYREKTIAVKALPANPWGLHQMHGNVWEWCQDEWREDLGMASVIDPQASLAKQDKKQYQEQVRRVLRGGSWLNLGWLCRSAVRSRSRADSRSWCIGFRLVLGLSSRRRSHKRSAMRQDGV